MDLDLVIASVLLEQAQKICDRVRSSWDEGMRPGISGKKEIRVNPEWGTLKNAVVIEILAQGQAAWELEFGKGSLMDRSLSSNPYLADYIDSDQWNDYRTGVSVRGRPEGTYSDLDGVGQDSTGCMRGLSLEKDIGSRDADFAPVSPQYIIGTEVKLSLPMITEALSVALSNAIADEVAYLLATKIYL